MPHPFLLHFDLLAHVADNLPAEFSQVHLALQFFQNLIPALKTLLSRPED